MDRQLYQHAVSLMLPSMQQPRPDKKLFIDENGRPAERVTVPGGMDVVVHYDEIPESDVTIVDGIRVTTPIRTMIDIATQVDSAEFARTVRDCLERRLFTVQAALQRIHQPDMADRRGARLLLAALEQL